MYRNLTSAVALFIVFGGGLMFVTPSQGCDSARGKTWTCYVPVVHQQVVASYSVTRQVQPTASYRLMRPEVTSGSRITLFANFLEKKEGKVDLCLNGTALPCKVIEWNDCSVTVELPRIGLKRPQDAMIRIIKPNGRQAKKLAVLFKGQPKIIVHAETIGQPDPSAPTSAAASYAPVTE